MRRYIAAAAIVFVACIGTRASAQAPATGEADPGVKPTRLIDRAEVRVTRVEIQPGATRRAHTHDDVVYHLWIPVEGSLQLTVGSDAPVPATSRQAFFMKRGTSHSFRNTGTTPGAVQILSRGVSVASAEPLGGVQTTLVQGRYAESEAAQPPPESAAAMA